MHVVIAGGGIGGLALAGQLSREGVRVTVIERDCNEDARPQGYRISIRREGYQALLNAIGEEQMELLKQRQEEHTELKDPSLYIISEKGKQIAKFQFNKSQVKDTITPSRYSLKKALLSRVPEESVLWNTKVIDYEEYEDKVMVEIITGEEEIKKIKCDILVGAEGTRSAVCAKLFPERKRVDSGSYAVLGLLDARHESAKIFRNKIMAGHGLCLGNGQFMYIAEQPPDNEGDHVKMMWGFASNGDCKGREFEPEQAIKDTLKIMTNSKWSPEIRQVVADSPIDTIRGPSQMWTSPPVIRACSVRHFRVVLIGDAIHAMVPARGQGASNALIDARVLASQLCSAHRGEINLQQALENYEREMIPRANKAVSGSMKSLKWFTARGVTRVLRDFIIRVLWFIYSVFSLFFLTRF